MPIDDAAAPSARRAGAPNGQGPWADPNRPATERVAALLSEMTLEEKLAQLYAIWVGIDPDSDDVAPFQHDLADPDLEFDSVIKGGLGQLTRPFGTTPLAAGEAAATLARIQTDIAGANRFGIPAIAHEECLTGFMTLGATILPTALAWGATFDPGLVREAAAAVGRSMRSVGIHQGLAPVLDVARDVRWGRTEETIGEDPYLVATIGTAYVAGLESADVVATLKHFAGYSASTAGRNFGPVAAGPRELADVLLPPFEMAIRDGGARSVMPSYTEIDGVPTSADPTLLTDLLRRRWGFTGTVVSDYFAVTFLEDQHRIASSTGAAAGLALTAGIDVELPAVRCYGEALLEAVRAGAVPEAVVERAAARVLTQKLELGLLDADWSPTPPALAAAGAADSPVQIDLDPPANRELARRLAEQSVIVVANGGVLPLRDHSRIAVVGPTADNPMAMLGCYAFPSHVGGSYHDRGPSLGVDIPTILEALRAEFDDATVDHAAGCAVDDPDTSGFSPAVSLAAQSDVVVAVLGDRAGLFGRGTSGEGCDAETLELPGVQAQLLDSLIETGTPVVLVLLTGRPYALGRFHDRVAAIVQAFFPGEEGAPAVAAVLSGRTNPSGRLPVSVPRSPNGTPATHLAPTLGHRTEVSTVDPTPLYPFGHGLSYTTFTWDDALINGRPVRDGPVEMTTDGQVTVSVAVRNDGERDGAEIVQLYLSDPVAQTTRPVVRLIGYARVLLAAGEQRRVSFGVHADLTSFTGLRGDRVVEPGEIELLLSRNAAAPAHRATAVLSGPERIVDHTRRLTTHVEIA